MVYLHLILTPLLRLTLTKVVFESVDLGNGSAGIKRLTLTKVVFEY